MEPAAILSLTNYLTSTVKGLYRRESLLPQTPLDVSKQPRRFRYHELAETRNNFASDYKHPSPARL